MENYDPIPTNPQKNNIAFALQTGKKAPEPQPSTSGHQSRPGRKRKRTSYETASESDSDEALFSTPPLSEDSDDDESSFLPPPMLKPRKFKFKPVSKSSAAVRITSMIEPQEITVNEPQETAVNEPQEIAVTKPQETKVAVNNETANQVADTQNENNSLFANTGLSAAAQAMLIVLNKEQILSKQRMDLMSQLATAELKKP